jgi:hypothetical protein
LPSPIRYESHREFVRETLRREVGLTAVGASIVPFDQEPEEAQRYRVQLNSQGSPSERVAAGYIWRPGTELTTHGPRVTADDSELLNQWNA